MPQVQARFQVVPLQGRFQQPAKVFFQAYSLAQSFAQMYPSVQGAVHWHPAGFGTHG